MSLRGVAKQTLAFLEAGRFTGPSGVEVLFADTQRAAVEGTRLYTPADGETLLLRTGRGEAPEISVTGETTQVAAHRLAHHQGLDVCALNFASARNAGGGFLNGAKAQEEDVTRCSGLYPCLLTQPTYYDVNRAQRSLLYTDHLIYSPRVPFFRTRSRDLCDYTYAASILTAPAPNAGQALRRDPGAGAAIEICMRRRAGKVLAAMRDRDERNLILGAWGCGVFRNDPAMVADAFGRWLEGPVFAGAFDTVLFAVYDRSKTKATTAAFGRRFTA